MKKLASLISGLAVYVPTYVSKYVRSLFSIQFPLFRNENSLETQKNVELWMLELENKVIDLIRSEYYLQVFKCTFYKIPLLNLTVQN